MEWRIATWADVEHVLDNLSEQHRSEYESIGFPGEIFNLRLLKFMMTGDTWCLWFDGQPQAFLSIAGTPAMTWLGVTKEAFDRGAGPIKAGRKKLREVADRRGPITSFITSKHPKVDQWMRLFGFEHVGGVSGGLKVFVFN